MSSTVTLDLSIAALFPSVPNPEQDPKCVLLTQIFQEMTTQKICIKCAKQQYEQLSTRISLESAKNNAPIMLQNGNSKDSVLMYFTFNLSEEDKKEFSIFLENSPQHTETKVPEDTEFVPSSTTAHTQTVMTDDCGTYEPIPLL